MRKIGAITTLLLIALFMVPLGAAAFGNGSSGPACPLPTAPGAVVVDISGKLMTAWKSDQASAGPVSVSLPAGTWDVYLTSYDDHSNKKHQAQTKEQWKLQGRLGDSVVFTTEATPDLSEATDVAYFGVGSITTAGPIDNVLALHAAYPDTLEPHSVAPLCAAFYPTGTAPRDEPSCPFPAGATVVNISTQLMLAWDKDASMAGPVPFSLPAGDWEVWLVSYDNHSAKSHQSQAREQWYLQGLLGGSVAFTSGTTPDLAEDKDLDIFFVGSLTSNQAIDAVKAVHAAYPADEPHSVAPLCAAFFSQASKTDSTPPGANTTPSTAVSNKTPDTTATTSDTTDTTSASSQTVTSSSTNTTAAPTKTVVSTATTATSVATTGGGDTGRTDSQTSETSVLAGLEGNTAQSLQQLPLTGIELETAFLAIVAIMFGVVLLRRARSWQSRLDRRAARVWRRPVS